MAGESINSLSVNLWVQPRGPNTPVEFLGCHTIGGVTKPKGTNTLNFCPDPVQPNAYKVSSKTKGPPGLVTFTIESKMHKLFDYLENLKCPVPIIAQVVDCAPKDQFWNYQRAFLFLNADNVQEGFSNLVSGGADNNEVMMTFDMEADDMIRLAPLRVYRDQSIAESEALNFIFACDVDICAGACGAAHEACDTMYAVSDAIAGSAAGRASLWIFENSTWTEAEADPFAVGENISSGGCFQVDRNTRRILVFRGTTDAGAPAEAAYTDNYGDSWTLVNIGSDNGEFVPRGRSVAVLGLNHIWVGTDSGRIYFSNNGGTSFVVQEDAGIHTGAWNFLQFIDNRTGLAGGAADIIAVTADGGQTWSQTNSTGTGGDITAGAMIDSNNFWVGTDDGRLFYTINGGVTWVERTGWVGEGLAPIKDIVFSNNLVGRMVVDDADGSSWFYETRNGGYTWERINTPINNGVNSMLACGNLLALAVGEALDGTPVIYRLQPES
jgi:hypothetical protein